MYSFNTLRLFESLRLHPWLPDHKRLIDAHLGFLRVEDEKKAKKIEAEYLRKMEQYLRENRTPFMSGNLCPWVSGDKLLIDEHLKLLAFDDPDAVEGLRQKYDEKNVAYMKESFPQRLEEEALARAREEEKEKKGAKIPDVRLSVPSSPSSPPQRRRGRPPKVPSPA